MDELRVYYAKGNKSDRERKVLYDITYIWNLKKLCKLSYIAKQTQRTNYWLVTSEEGEGGGAH